MNNTFDIKRFGRYFSTEFTTLMKNNWVTLLILVCLGLISELTVGLFATIFSGHWVGIPVYLRFIPLAVMVIIITMAIPAKFYGKVTDKKAGSAYLMLPASRLEKFISMILISVVIVPFASIAAYVGIDALIAVCDPTIDNTVICSTHILPEGFIENGFFKMGDMTEPILSSALVNPLLYADDFIFGILIYLLGATYFKKNKVVKTVVACIVVSFAINILTSLGALCFGDSVLNMMDNENTPKFFLHIARHAGLYDTINDTIFNCGFLAAIWFRMKNLKH